MPSLSSFVVVWLLSAAVLAQGQPPNTATRESTTTATVDRIERNSRVVTLRSKDNLVMQVYVDPTIKLFDELNVGDVVTARYTESIVVAVTPNAKLSAPKDTTEAARKAGNENVLEQQKTVVTIENIDSQRMFVRYRTQDNQLAMFAVQNKALLDGIREGDRVEVTLTRARALSIERRKP
jgi:Cu/Ag efflux protein CusF